MMRARSHLYSGRHRPDLLELACRPPLNRCDLQIHQVQPMKSTREKRKKKVGIAFRSPICESNRAPRASRLGDADARPAPPLLLREPLFRVDIFSLSLSQLLSQLQFSAPLVTFMLSCSNLFLYKQVEIQFCERGKRRKCIGMSLLKDVTP